MATQDHARSNNVLAGVVEVGLLMESDYGRREVLEYMRQNGVPQSVAQRVLSSPRRRRAPRLRELTAG